MANPCGYARRALRLGECSGMHPERSRKSVDALDDDLYAAAARVGDFPSFIALFDAEVCHDAWSDTRPNRSRHARRNRQRQDGQKQVEDALAAASILPGANANASTFSTALRTDGGRPE